MLLSERIRITRFIGGKMNQAFSFAFNKLRAPIFNVAELYAQKTVSSIVWPYFSLNTDIC